MTLYNPFFKFLDPRNSGLIAFKGGGGGGATTEEVQTIVQEEAAPVVESISNVSSNIGSASPTGTVTSSEESFVTPIVESTDAEGNVTSTGGETVNYGGNEVAVTDTVKGDTETIIGNQSNTDNLINQRFDTFQPATVVNQTVDTSDLAKSAAMDAGFAGVRGNQESILSDTKNIMGGVDGLGSKLTEVGGQVGEVGNKVTTGFDTVGNKLNDISGNVGERFDTVDNTLSKGFTDATDQISTGFGNQASTLETLSSNVLGGQTSLQEYLEKVSGKQDTYFGGLSEGQANIQSGLGGLQTNFSDFQKQYTDDTTLANQARADLQSQVTGGFNLVRDDISQSNDMAEQQRSRIARDAEDDTQQMQSSFGAALRNIDAGVEAQSQVEVNTRNDIKQRLATIKQVILQDGANLDPNLSMQFAKFADSFDENGSLIKSSTDNRGNVTQRALDNENNLNLATFANTGTLVSRDSINVDEVMSAMDRLGYTGAQNNQGLMSQGAPFNSTFS